MKKIDKVLVVSAAIALVLQQIYFWSLTKVAIIEVVTTLIAVSTLVWYAHKKGKMSQKPPTSLAVGKNYEGFKDICDHLKENLYLTGNGIDLRTTTEKLFFDAELGSLQSIRIVRLSFDCDTSQLTLAFLFASGSVPNDKNGKAIEARIYEMAGFPEDTLTEIRMTVREWIYDNVISNEPRDIHLANMD